MATTRVGASNRTTPGSGGAHVRRQAEREGFTFDPDIETVFERFEVAWPGAAPDG